VTLIAFVLALLATLYPSWRASASIRRRRCAMSEPILIARGVSKVFRGGGLEVPVLSDIDLAVRRARPSPSSALPVPARARCCTCSAGWTSPRPAR
jgi:hypothetical protein